MSWTIETFVAKAKQLRRQADAAEAEFLDFLVACERENFWREAAQDYPKFLETNDIVKAIRYTTYKRAREKLGEATTGVGVEAVLRAGAARSKEEAQSILDQARAFERSNQTSISAQSAGRIARETRAFFLGRQKSKGYSSLVEENQKLRETLARLKEENVALLAFRDPAITYLPKSQRAWMYFGAGADRELKPRHRVVQYAMQRELQRSQLTPKSVPIAVAGLHDTRLERSSDHACSRSRHQTRPSG